MGLESSTLRRWPGLQLVERMTEGARNEVWRARIGELDVAVRRSRRPTESLLWELDLIEFLAQAGFAVAEIVPTSHGERQVEGVVVQWWLDGREPASDDDWRVVAATLSAVHELAPDYPQRPGCCVISELAEKRRSVDADLDALPAEVEAALARVFAPFRDFETSLVHGDPDESNLRIMADGRVGLLDLDESRVDLSLLDLCGFGIPVLEPEEHRRGEALSHAWEVANGWVVEPQYARKRLRMLRDMTGSGHTPMH